MAVRIFENAAQRIDNPLFAGMVKMPFDAKQSFSANNAGNGRSSAFGSKTNYIIVEADEDIRVQVGDATATAGASDFPISAGEKQAFWVAPGQYLAAWTA